MTLIAVGTPFDGQVIDLRYIKAVSREIGAALAKKDGYHVVVVKSTVVPGTTEDVVLPILEEYSGKKAGNGFGIGMNPEFLREGSAVQDFMYPDRIVLGGWDEQSRAMMARLYAVFPETKVIQTNCRTAEMIKYTANSLLATQISFANEIANLCAAIGGVDVCEVMAGVHLDKRLSPMLGDGQRVRPGILSYLEAGCGFGGSCFPKDVKALIAYGDQLGQEMEILKSVIRVNQRQPERLIKKLFHFFPEIQGVRVSVLGLAFKPGTDDLRESPAIPVVNSLLAHGAAVTAYDPVASDAAARLFPTKRVRYCQTLEEAVADAQAILILTRWDEFKAIPRLLEDYNNHPVVIDGRRLLPKDCVPSYAGIGLS